MVIKGIKSRLSADRRENRNVGLIFISPFIIGVVLIFVQVIITSVRLAFSETVVGQGGLGLTFIGWKNFYHALRIDANFIPSLLNTLQSMLTTAPMILFFSLFVAVLLNTGIKGRSFYRAVFFLPVIVTTGLIAKMDSNNAVMQAMTSAAASAGEESVSLGDVSVFLQQLEFSPGLISVVSEISSQIVNIVNLSGVQILIFLAALQSISPSVYEAADVEGANAWSKFWKITIPMVVPVMLVNLLYTVIDFLTRDNTYLMKYVQNVAFVQGKYGGAAAMSWFYCLSVFVILAAAFGVFKLIQLIYNKDDDERGGRRRK